MPRACDYDFRVSDARTHRISLAMIVRDEARSLARCLESVRDHVDEMVVVDTGSSDNTVQLAEDAGAIVHHFAWVDDFSAARNAALAHCTGDWILVLDGDEWLESGAETLASLRSLAPSFAGFVERVDHLDEQLAETSPHLRVLPAGTRYQGRIHEQPQVTVERRRLAVRIGHDGYQPEQNAKKAGRNRRLLEVELRDDPDNAYLWYKLGSEYSIVGEHAAAIQGFERAYQLSEPTSPASPLWRHWFVVQYLTCLLASGRSQDAIDLAFAELEHWEHSADFQFMLGQTLLLHALLHPELRDDVMPMAEQAWQTCLTLGDSDLYGAVPGRGSFLAARELVRLYEMLGREDDAARFRPLAESPS